VDNLASTTDNPTDGAINTRNDASRIQSMARQHSNQNILRNYLFLNYFL
jgi:hypothetical protein